MRRFTPIRWQRLRGRKRVQVCRPPAVAAGTLSLTIQRPSSFTPTIAGLAAGGLFARTENARVRVHPLDAELARLHRAKDWEAFFPLAVQAKKTIILSGDTGSGKTTMAKALVGAVPLHERLITIEDTAEFIGLPFTFGEVLRLLSSVDGAASIIGRIEARRQANKPYTEATVKALEDYLKGSADLVNSIRKTITARLSLWFNPRIDAATAASDFDLRELRYSLHAIYVGVTPDNIARLRPLLSLFFQQLIDLNIRTLPQFDPAAKHQLFLLLDEFPLLGPMPVLADAFAYVAGYNIRIMLIMQSKAQLRDRDLYGLDKAEAILDNCGLEVVFGTKDLKLTEELSARLACSRSAHAVSATTAKSCSRG